MAGTMSRMSALRSGYEVRTKRRSSSPHNSHLLDLQASDGVTVKMPECQRGIGCVVLRPGAAELIDGVMAQPFSIWPDDRGYFMEVLRVGQGLAADFPAESTQVSATCSRPGAIKAFHYHRRQIDCWSPARGMLQVALVDLRPSSRTFGVKNTLYLGELRAWQLRIPPGVAHGYKVISDEPAMLVYVTSRFYDPSDEGRIAYNEAAIGYDWETQHR